MTDRAYGVKQSDFTAQTSIPSGSYLGFFANGYNYKISYTNFLSGLGVTGTIVQDGAVTGTPVLDVQGTVNNIRNLEDGAGIVTNVSAENGIEISHNFTVDTTGERLMLNESAASPTFVSLVSGSGIALTTVGNTIEFDHAFIVNATGTPLVLNATQATPTIVSLVAGAGIGVTAVGNTVEISNDLASIYGQVYMQGNATATVIASTSTPVLVAGTWTVDIQQSFTATTAGRLTYTGTETQVIRIEASLSASPVSGANQHISAYIAKNGSVITGSRQTSHISNGADMNMTIVWQVSAATNDYFELFVQNATATNNVTVSRVVLSAH